MRAKAKNLGIGFILLALGGCGAGEEQMNASATSDVSAGAAAPVVSGAAASKGSEQRAGAPQAAKQGATAQLIQMASAVPRKIIYNATVDLVADNFSKAENGLLKLIQIHRGYLAETNIGAAPGTPRQGTWKIRVPETQFAAFMADVVKLGELQTTQTDSQDVTAEFTDLQARISNKQTEEKRLLILLQRSTAKLGEVLQVEREISRVRGEIEQMQGRLRLLANMSALTTITVTLHEVKGYVPPQPTTFGSQIARTFESSLGGLRDFGQGAVLILVAALPWIPLLALIGFPLWKIARRQNNKP